MSKVLVIDDELMVLEDLAAYLGYKGYTALTAMGGEEGLKMIESHRPDLVLLDMNMPGVTGADVLKEIRAKYAALPVVIITGYHLDDFREVLSNFDHCVFLKKPIEFEKLDAALYRFLENRTP